MRPILWIIASIPIYAIVMVGVYLAIKRLYWRRGPWYKPLRYGQIRSQVYCSCEKGQG
jgi:hypothetical protein